MASKALYRLWIMKTHAEIESASCFHLVDPNADPRLRDISIRYMPTKAGRSGLLALSGAVGDPTPIPVRSLRLTVPFLSELLEYLTAADKKPAPTVLPKRKPKSVKKAPATLGELAQQGLKSRTGKDFGTDREAWVRWIERHRR